MNGDSFIKIYIKHIQNICKGKIALIHILNYGPEGTDTEYKNRKSSRGKNYHTCTGQGKTGQEQTKNSVPTVAGTLSKDILRRERRLHLCRVKILEFGSL